MNLLFWIILCYLNFYENLFFDKCFGFQLVQLAIVDLWDSVRELHAAAFMGRIFLSSDLHMQDG